MRVTGDLELSLEDSGLGQGAERNSLLFYSERTGVPGSFLVVPNFMPTAIKPLFTKLPG